MNTIPHFEYNLRFLWKILRTFEAYLSKRKYEPQNTAIMSNTEELNGLTYIGDAPMVYKHSAYEIYYSPLYVQMVGDRPFFAIKTDDAVEAIALCKPGKKQMLNRDVPFDYNAENDNVCVNIPNYGF